MASYGSATFSGLSDSAGWYDEPTQETNVTKTHVPYADYDVVQSGGLGVLEIEVELLFTDATQWGTFNGYKGDGTPRTLTHPNGDSYPNCVLVAAKPRRLGTTDNRRVMARFWQVTV